MEGHKPCCSHCGKLGHVRLECDLAREEIERGGKRKSNNPIQKNNNQEKEEGVAKYKENYMNPPR